MDDRGVDVLDRVLASAVGFHNESNEQGREPAPPVERFDDGLVRTASPASAVYPRRAFRLARPFLFEERNERSHLPLHHFNGMIQHGNHRWFQKIIDLL